MSPAMLGLPNEVERIRSTPSSSLPSKRSIGSSSRPRFHPLPSVEKNAGRRNTNLQRQPDSPIVIKKQNHSNTPKSNTRCLVMEDVKILKRGEAVRPISPSSTGCNMENTNPCLTDQLGPDPMSLPKSRHPAYAGPAFISSPAPNSLPVPFFIKETASKGKDVTSRSLRCLLLLDASL